MYGLDIVDIYSSSWGPPDNGLEIRGLGPMAKRSLREGTEKVDVIGSDGEDRTRGSLVCYRNSLL